MKKALQTAKDFGAEGIISPMINTAADARALVAATKYPPLGERSWGPHRATMLADIADQKDYLREANQLIVTLAMIRMRSTSRRAPSNSAMNGAPAGAIAAALGWTNMTRKKTEPTHATPAPMCRIRKTMKNHWAAIMTEA